MTLINLTQNISYIPSSTKPFSCDVVFIKGRKFTWIFDCGTTKEIADEINRIQTPKNIVISHFHPDHILNLARVNYDNLYVSKYTKKYTFKGTVLESDFITQDYLEQTITANLQNTKNTQSLQNSLAIQNDDKNQIKIFHLPSSHAKGCLCLACGDYCFMGDGTYAKELIGNHYYNAQLLLQMINVMENIDAKYFCLSHDKNFVQNKETVIALYKDIYKRRQEGNPKISVEDFFNADGTVKTDM